MFNFNYYFLESQYTYLINATDTLIFLYHVNVYLLSFLVSEVQLVHCLSCVGSIFCFLLVYYHLCFKNFGL